MGFPQEILADLTGEDIRQCQGAKQVVVQQHEYEMVSGEYGEIRNDAGAYLGMRAVQRTLCITGVAVELAGEIEQWKLIHHFYWTTAPKMMGTEGIQVWTADHVDLSWYKAESVSGYVLYDQADITYMAPYYSVEETETSWKTNLAFSFPKDGERYRGYVTYTIQKQGIDGYIDSLINYMHQTDWFQYPVRSAVEYRGMYGFIIGEKPYDLAQDGLQFYPPWLGRETSD